jgi:hypothetical protein
MAWPAESGSLGLIELDLRPSPGRSSVIRRRPSVLTQTSYRAPVLSFQRWGTSTIIVTAVSSLSGNVYYHWYLDGQYIASRLNVNTITVRLAPGDQGRIECRDTNDATFDPVLNAPIGHPASRTLYWPRSMDADVSYYRIEQNAAGAGWVAIGQVGHTAYTWQYQFQTSRLTDLVSYQWRVIPVDTAGNDGTPVTLDAEIIVRTPDAPDFSISWSAITTKVTFS